LSPFRAPKESPSIQGGEDVKTDIASMPAPEKIPFWRNPTIRAYWFQAVMLVGLVLLALGLFLLFRYLIQAEGNGKNSFMLAAGVVLFTGSLGCFYTSISLVETYTYTHASTYVTALVNTLKVSSVIGCVLSTFLGC
jgi:hypothetical protein